MREAAKLTPSGQMEVFQNWKSDLFQGETEKAFADSTAVAIKFFEWLKVRLEEAGINLRKCETRVAMPAFENLGEKAGLIARCMDHAGWDDPSLILKVTEPHANTIGLFTRGRNAGGRDPFGEVLLNYSKMFGQDHEYIQRARNATLFDSQEREVKVMVVDIGGFTTDIA
jgi:hypothetical protein